MTDRIVLVATRSEGKLRELRPMLAEAGFVALGLAEAQVAENPEEAQIEVFDTFEENAVAKARYFHGVTGLPTIADDSGLVVEALGGAPGVRSKRWSGRTDLSGQALDDANNERLLAELRDEARRDARYVCVVAWVDAHRELVGRGETAGEIVETARGEGGFGYDPYFFSRELRATFGESAIEAKAAVSHRGRAMRALFSEVGHGR